ncbi:MULTISPECIES: hypothetical protein [unclassified Paenibacillus]|uniref:hypothetical protein n=1 Tax=unclassified Paenibacillus TaxID=185978 RepID=UPI0007101F0D|nr:MULTISPECIES: hypothetical protein [unclassified Paenibacillus]KQX48505.1 hypothetical protein ASD40_09915 [Paenibacillus sp. Root444D2]KRE49784.1 hypothetical protein ASG85_23185 [Paenibacillus sp. Soil724D2]
MTTLHNENLEVLRDDFCCEYGQLFAERVGGLRNQDEQVTQQQFEPPTEEMNTMKYLHQAGLQEEYLL